MWLRIALFRKASMPQKFTRPSQEWYKMNFRLLRPSHHPYEIVDNDRSEPRSSNTPDKMLRSGPGYCDSPGSRTDHESGP